MISKELLSKVLDIKVNEFHFGMLGNMVEYDECRSINIHELAFKCKEWAEKNSLFMFVVCENIVYIDDNDSLLNEGGFYYTEDFTAETEPEAIFKACEWILSNKASKC